MSKIGILGGTFDPIHHGHLILAREACEQLELEKLIFVPAAVSPHKIKCASSPPAIRLQMVQAAIDSEPGFGVDDCELRREAPSYAIETVELFRQRKMEAKLFYLIGEDNVATLPSWHRFEELCKLVQFVVLDRSGFAASNKYPVIRLQIDISATDIRKRVATGRSIRYLVPPAVEEIIHRYQLYQEPKK